MTSKNKIQEIISLIFSFARTLHQKNDGHKIDPISMLQLKVLGFVAETREVTMKDVADYFKITSPSATDIINRLVRSGNLRRRPNARDKRIVQVAITLKGLKTLYHGYDKITAKMSNIFKKLNRDEQQQLINILKKIS